MNKVLIYNFTGFLNLNLGKNFSSQLNLYLIFFLSNYEYLCHTSTRVVLKKECINEILHIQHSLV